ncbi:MAG TPA: class I SAM-dependent methyltransferase [Solirubrobacteraceae bacterium]|nr:class I SAM-dependent methyltransferase [Solirubrobacteraceae bacterium]
MLGEWSDPERVAEYLSREIPYRDIAERMLLEALPEQIECFLDLGTGDGRLLALLHEHYPRARGVGIDSSRPMLDRAAERFAGDPLIALREHDLADMLTDLAPLDAVVSALTIHHLADQRKRTLFSEIHALLTPGGVFVNLDLVASPTPDLHERFRQAIGRAQDDPTDRLARLCEQLGWLRDAGFEQTDCRFKWLELALMVAVRATDE